MITRTENTITRITTSIELTFILARFACLSLRRDRSHTTIASRLQCSCPRHFVPRKFHMNFRVNRPKIVNLTM